MKRIVVALSSLYLVILSVNGMAGVTLGNLEDLGSGTTTPNQAAQPGSNAYGKSLASWVEAYLRNLFEGDEIPANNVEFLPIVPDGSAFYIEVKPGTALVLPIALWLGFAGDPELGPTNFTGMVTLDGEPIAVPNQDYYIQPTYIDPPIIELIAFYEGLAVVIKPLTPGEHTIQLYSTINNIPDVGLMEFSNTWNITVIPPGKK